MIPTFLLITHPKPRKILFDASESDSYPLAIHRKFYHFICLFPKHNLKVFCGQKKSKKKFYLYQVSIAIKLAATKRCSNTDWKGVTQTRIPFFSFSISEHIQFLFKLSHVFLHLSSSSLSEYKAHCSALFTISNEKPRLFLSLRSFSCKVVKEMKTHVSKLHLVISIEGILYTRFSYATLIHHFNQQLTQMARETSTL